MSRTSTRAAIGAALGTAVAACLLTISPAGPAQAGLLAQYPLDGDAADVSGNGKDGQISGATFTADRFGNAAAALYCDGNDYVQTPQDSNFKPLSFSVWFRADNVAGERSIVDSDIGGRYGHSLIIGYAATNNTPFPGTRGDGTLDVQFHNGAHDTGQAITAGQWYHAVVNYSTTVEVYLDGVLVFSTPYTGTAFDGSNFRFCRHNPGDPQFFIGAIDDVRFFDVVLTQAEVTELFTGPDADGDGVADSLDNCPAVANTGQENNDGDALGDVCDDDDDNDGVIDVVDNCPIHANTFQEDDDFDGLGNACDASFDAGPVVAHIEAEVTFMVDSLKVLNVPGGNGMIAKLTGNGGVVQKVGNAVDAFEGGLIDLETYLSELQGALDKLTAFDNQLAAKAGNGQISEADATDLSDASAEVRATINALIADATS